jgi:hypothetical protein
MKLYVYHGEKICLNELSERTGVLRSLIERVLSKKHVNDGDDVTEIMSGLAHYGRFLYCGELLSFSELAQKTGLLTSELSGLLKRSDELFGTDVTPLIKPRLFRLGHSIVSAKELSRMLSIHTATVINRLLVNLYKHDDVIDLQRLNAEPFYLINTQRTTFSEAAKYFSVHQHALALHLFEHQIPVGSEISHLVLRPNQRRRPSIEDQFSVFGQLRTVSDVAALFSIEPNRCLELLVKYNVGLKTDCSALLLKVADPAYLFNDQPVSVSEIARIIDSTKKCLVSLILHSKTLPGSDLTNFLGIYSFTKFKFERRIMSCKAIAEQLGMRVEQIIKLATEANLTSGMTFSRTLIKATHKPKDSKNKKGSSKKETVKKVTALKATEKPIPTYIYVGTPLTIGAITEQTGIPSNVVSFILKKSRLKPGQDCSAALSKVLAK